MGVFAPENAQSALMMLSMMDFEGKDEIVAKVSEGQTLMNQLQELQMQYQQLLGFVAKIRGGVAPGMQMGGTMPSNAPTGGQISGNPIEVATRGAERASLTNYGQRLVDRANNIKEE
jgi:hypothetical protein